MLNEIFLKLGIEYFSVLDYRHVRETAEHIRRRAGITPRSVIVYIIPYFGGACENISKYAAAGDYHIVAREIGQSVIEELRKKFPELNARAFGDHSPIDERHAALISGLGIAGDNGLLINEKYGSYIFIGDIVTDIPPEELSAAEPAKIKRCEGCGACRKACPTGVLRGECGACLSAITQKKGELSSDEAELMRRCNTVWGCDICQDVCPHNSSPKITPIKFFTENRITALTKECLDSLSDEALSERAFGWRGREVLRRNIAILAGKDEKEKPSNY